MRLLLSLFILLFSMTLQAETFLWKVSNGNNVIYLGGTFHLLAESDYPLPAEFEQAYQRVNWLVFETDISALKTPEFQQQFQQAFLLPQGQTLRSQLNDTTWQQLKSYCRQRQIPLPQYQHMNAQFVSLVLVMHELNRFGMTAEGVDNHFYNKAVADGKQTSQLESITAQIQYLANMAAGNENNLIRQTIADARQLESMLNQMRHAWRSGDQQQMTKLGIEPLQRDYPALYRSLLVERNNNWMPRLHKLLAHPEAKLVLVGALHLAGPDGLLQQLQQAGYQVSQLTTVK